MTPALRQTLRDVIALGGTHGLRDLSRTCELAAVANRKIEHHATADLFKQASSELSNSADSVELMEEAIAKLRDVDDLLTRCDRIEVNSPVHRTIRAIIAKSLGRTTP